MMKLRAISPLATTTTTSTTTGTGTGETRIVHVTTIVRHGARTPVLNLDEQCWEGFWENPDTGVWNCSLILGMVPPSHQDTVSSAVFDKTYDALMEQQSQPQHDHLSNRLHGTCQSGQLLEQGFDQHVFVGQLLRSAYAYDSNNYDHDIQMRLLDLNAQNQHPWEEPQVHLRADDEQRTLLSGEILLRSLFAQELEKAASKKSAPVHIPIHTADYERDILSVNERICPRLAQLRESFEQSSAYASFQTSKEVKELHNFMTNKLKASTEMDIVGCIMPTICTDRPLHDAFEYDKDDTNNNNMLFDRMVDYGYQKWNLHLLHNNAEYAKLASAPLWNEIMNNIHPIVSAKDDEIPNKKMAIISGHDDTISPIMASLGIWNATSWPPYASMLLMELHELVDEDDRSIFPSKFAFRIVYNGNILTNHMKGCPQDSELCDIQILTDLVSSFAGAERNCQVQTSFEDAVTSKVSGGTMNFLMALLGVAVGGAGMFCYLTRSLPLPSCFRSRKYESSLSVPEIRYNDEPYQDDPDKNGATFLD